MAAITAGAGRDEAATWTPAVLPLGRCSTGSTAAAAHRSKLRETHASGCVGANRTQRVARALAFARAPG